MSDHEHLYSFCRVSFWKDWTACKGGDDWTRCTVSPLGMYTYGEQSFENNDQGIAARDALIAFLDKAYEIGRSHAKREIREVLGVKEPRS
ncbi:hypothetical protein DEM27_19860 [Metarhizobium album]|uniref:Uncharacterized protein n=1 Tax=Metarhizobium album TaxID=2182425 RepID=A0A2U2DM48_9HYPH|nr:hypothetical protein [Rhizobium album]PWE54373.1 hypothetical protein DEM27_19860 [Rhizobium album]